uniref:Peptidase C1A papain C-terminal domain-containing protein n=1 Tax=Zooxanthella nutricula TaxID=1333877 RepID=A0A7S2VTM3_9DINO
MSSGALPVLSPQQLVSCAPNPLKCGGTGGCGGSIAEFAYSYIQQFGMTTEEVYPYAASTGKCVWNASMGEPRVRIGGYRRLPPNSYTAVMLALARVGPLAVNVAADDMMDYEGGVFAGCGSSGNVDINHVVQLVGYGTDPHGGDYWLVRNSWGTSWGESGYIRLRREATPACGEDRTPLDGTGCAGGESVQTVCGACGILFDASHPIDAVVVQGGEASLVV